MGRDLTERGRRRRRQLLEEAARRFAARGYHATSVAEIVEALGVGKGVFYWYFDSKEQLFVELLRDAQRELRRAQQAAFRDETDPLERIAAGMRASMRWFDAHRDLVGLFAQAATSDRFRPVLAEGQQIAVADIVRHLKDAIATGRVRDMEPEVLAHSILAVWSELARRFVLEGSRDPEEVADAAVAFVMGGLRGT